MDAVQTSRAAAGYRTAVAAFVAGLLVGLAVDRMTEQAEAQVLPNAAQQRVDLREGISQLSGQVGELADLLRNGTFKVRVIETDKKSGASGAGRAADPPRPTPGAVRPVLPPAGPVTGESDG